VQARGRQLEVQTVAVARERDRLLSLATERRAALRELESKLAGERRELDTRAKDERLRQISLIEEQYRCAQT
jgi:hypothetical protein